VYFIEFIEPKPDVSLERFRDVVKAHVDRWAGEHPEDELVLNVGRTWWLGPQPAYITAWRIGGVATLAAWQAALAQPEAGEHHDEFSQVATIVHAGLYEDLGAEMA
jgi:hypothetical protein